MLGDQRVEFPDELSVAADIEVELEPPLERGKAKLLEARRLRLREPLVHEIGERRAAPERERLVQRVDLVAFEQSFEPLQIELARPDGNFVAGWACDDPVGSERLPELRDVVLNRIERGLRRVRSPELIDEAIGRDDLVAAGEQQRQQSSLPSSAETNRSGFVDDLERAED